MLFDDPNKLSNEDIREQLTALEYPSSLIETIIEQFWFHDWGNSFLEIPEHFNILKKYLEKSKIDAFSRYDFYNFYFQQIVPNYARLVEPLQELGISFEILQTDTLSIKEWEELLKEINSPEELSLDLLSELQLINITTNEEGQNAKWSHHTFTEFLAADYLLKSKNFTENIEKFMSTTNSSSITFTTSWTGVMRFLLEKKAEELVDWITKGIKTNSEFLSDPLSETVIYFTHDSLPDEYKSRIFHAIYDFYQNKKWWMPVWTYRNLFKFIDEKTYQILKDNADNSDFIYRGNIAAIIDGMLMHAHPLTRKDKHDFWKEKLISYANDRNLNGVLQRHAFAALENYKGETDIIDRVKSKTNSTDSLLRDAYIHMLMMVDPNYSVSVRTFVDAIADNSSHVYARMALYSIDQPESVQLLLKLASNNHNFIHEIIDNDSIFNKERKKADDILIKNIEENWNEKTLTLLQLILIRGASGNENYHAGDSYFLQQVARIIQLKEPKFLEQLMQLIGHLQPDQRSRVFINDIEGIVAVLLKTDEIEGYRDLFTESFHYHAPYTLAEAIRKAESVGNPEGKEILAKGIALGITRVPKTAPKFDDAKKERESTIYKEFHKYLFPEKEGTYVTSVFSIFIENQKIIEEQWDEKDKEKLLFLAVDINLKSFDPAKLQVRYKNSESKTGEYTISSIAGYFTDVLRVVSKLKPELLESPQIREKLINFIPFVYLSDFKIIQEIIGDVSDQDIVQLNETMMDKTKDTRYLVPQTYIYFANLYPKLKTTKAVLISFVQDALIREDDRVEAMKLVKNQLSPASQTEKNIFTSLWNRDVRTALSDTANSILISVYKDDDAIKWRLQKIKDAAEPFHRQEGFHSVGDLEMEIDYKHFAMPIIELGDEKYLPEIIKLLNFSLTLTDNEYLAYAEYLQQIAVSYVVRDDFLLSTDAYAALKDWAKQNESAKDINWFEKRLENAFNRSNTTLNKKNKISDAIALLKHE